MAKKNVVNEVTVNSQEERMAYLEKKVASLEEIVAKLSVQKIGAERKGGLC